VSKNAKSKDKKDKKIKKYQWQPLLQRCKDRKHNLRQRTQNEVYLLEKKICTTFNSEECALLEKKKKKENF